MNGRNELEGARKRLKITGKDLTPLNGQKENQRDD